VLEFNEERHEYTWNGKRVPSVTQALQLLGGYEGIPMRVLEKAATRGTAVHKATELYDLGTLDWSTVSDEVFGYLEGWMKFLEVEKPEIIEVEKLNYHEKFMYAGAMDRTMILRGKKAILDIKSSFMLMPSCAPQTAAYLEMENQHIKAAKDKFKKRYGLRLTPDGDYELKEWGIYLESNFPGGVGDQIANFTDGLLVMDINGPVRKIVPEENIFGNLVIGHGEFVFPFQDNSQSDVNLLVSAPSESNGDGQLWIYQ
jgi:hypothetical protein